VFVGLVDGRILWNNLHNLKHPLGATYAQVYNYLSCLGSNPCWLWLNKNETWRNHGSRRAQELNAQYGRVNKKYINYLCRLSEKEALKTLKCLINHSQFMI
jgi:acyloxyacyl hydrolase